MGITARSGRLAAAAIVLGMGWGPGSAGVAWAAPSDATSTDGTSADGTVASGVDGAGTSRPAATRQRSRRGGNAGGSADSGRVGVAGVRGAPSTAFKPEDAPELTSTPPVRNAEPPTARVQAAASVPAASAAVQQPVRTEAAGGVSASLPPARVPVDTPAALSVLPTAALAPVGPAAGVSVVGPVAAPVSLSAPVPLSIPAAPPLMVSELAKPTPLTELVQSVASFAAGLLGTNPDSPLAWGVLAGARNPIGRYRRGAPTVEPGAATATGLLVPSAGGSAAPAFAPDEVLLAWKPGVSASNRAQAMGAVQATVMERLGTQKMLQTDEGVVYRLKAPGGTSAAIAALSKNPNVAFVEPNYRVSLAATSNDPYYTGGSLWGMSSDDSPTAYGPSGTTNQYGCGAEEAWGLGATGSRDIVVGVIDEGMQITHPDLAANVWTNPGEIAGDGIDNDANGYVDDVNGWDFYHHDNTVYDAGEDAHGTHVAGTIGGVGGNGTGVSGVNWNVQMIPAKFLGPTGGYISDAVSALNYLVDLKSKYNIKLVAVNNSWGGGGYSSAMHGAINRAAKADILFVAAAGNATSDNDTTASYPSNYSSLQAATGETAASYESVVAVASITSTGGLSSFSNYGATTVDIGAPGSGIYSTVPTDTYASYNGTSMASPHVTGALALYASQNPTATAAALRSAILNNAKPTTSLTGKTVTGGRLSLEGLFNSPPPPSGATCDPAVTGISAPATISANRNANVTVNVANLGNTDAQVNVALTATGGTPGPSTTLTVPAGGKTSTVLVWKSPKSRGAYTVTATAKLINTTIVDANPANNSASVVVTVQ